MNNQEVAIEKNRNTDILVTVSDYKGNPMLGIREYWLDARNPGQRNPSRKGISVPLRLGNELLVALTQVLNAEAQVKAEKAMKPTPKAVAKVAVTKAKTTKGAKTK